LLLAVLSIVAVGASTGATAQEIPDVIGKAPNILIIVTDDQRADSLGVMPETRRRFKEEGTYYPNGYVTTPLCCPARASVFTGQYAHNHGVRKNTNPTELDQTETIQRYLKQAGYATAISGKFLNTWPLEQAPQFFDRWSIFRRGYYNADFNVDGQITEVPDYSTDFVAKKAAEYLDSFETIDQRPWFLYVAPAAPHKPFIAEPKYDDSRVPPRKQTPSVTEKSRGDKPPFIRHRAGEPGAAKVIHEEQLQMLKSVDDMVARVFRTMDDLDETRDTLAFFLSDNGYLLGEHGVIGKRLPYTDSVRVPFMVRWPAGTDAPRVDERIATNIDIAPTVIEAVELPTEPSTFEMDGIPLDAERQHSHLFMESWGNYPKNLPDWVSIRTKEYQYVEYFARPGMDGGFVSYFEYYDLVEDPWQLTNLFENASLMDDPDVEALHRQIRSDMKCAGATCP